MKSIFKKNQIIITALALMIAVAGYLNFTKDKADTPDQAVNSSSVGSDIFAETDENDNYADITDENTAAGSEQVTVNDKGDLVVGEKGNEAATSETTGTGEVTETTAGEATDTGTDQATTDGTQAAGEQEVSSPGDAILASTTLNSGYFSTARLTREQIRAKNKETLMSLIADVNVSEEQKQAAIDGIIEMTATAEKENAAEILLEAKGFDGAVVSLIDGKVDVVVNSETITDAQVAQIEDIVTRKTGVEVGDITITSVIVED